MSTHRFKPGETVDFAVVGSGAAGGVIARELSQAGFSVLVFEQGPRFTPADFEHDELKYLYLSGITVDPKVSPQTFRRDASVTATLAHGDQPALYARMVGGSSNHYTANFWRFHEIDFNERSALGAISGTGFADWPISYQELEPYYTKVEWEIGVSGLAEASPFDPPRSRPYPMPPLPVKSSGVLFEQGARKLGLHPFPAPMAITSQPFRGRPACISCGFCMGFGCEARAKSSTLYTMIPEAEATGRCEVRSGSYVYRVATDARGRASVHYFDAQKRDHFQQARAVVLSANGAETARLLLNSTSNRFPQGLANSSGLVGKYLMFNQGGVAHGVFEHELNEYKSVQVTRVLHDFYQSDPKRGFYGGGGGMDGRINPQPACWAATKGGDLPLWGAEFKARLEAFTRSMVVCGHTTSLAVESNSVSIDPQLKDAWAFRPCESRTAIMPMTWHSRAGSLSGRWRSCTRRAPRKCGAKR